MGCYDTRLRFRDFIFWLDHFLCQRIIENRCLRERHSSKKSPDLQLQMRLFGFDIITTYNRCSYTPGINRSLYLRPSPLRFLVSRFTMPEFLWILCVFLTIWSWFAQNHSNRVRFFSNSAFQTLSHHRIQNNHLPRVVSAKENVT